MSNEKLTVDRVVEHHLSQNANQKLTPHLITGLVALISANIRSAGLTVDSVGLRPENTGATHD